MKTKLLIFRMIISVFMLGIVACSDKMYRINTQINGNGSGVRTIYTHGDSIFLSGDTSKNPLLFTYMPEWRFQMIDTIESLFDKDEIYNISISKSFRSINELQGSLSFAEELRPLFAPAERWEKHFRWFYTYYSYESVFPNIPVPVSIDQYMSKDEQKCWFQGDFSIYRGKSGFECKAELDDLEEKFYTWYTRNSYEVSFNSVRHFAEQIAGDTYFSGLENVKDTLFILNLKDLIKSDMVRIHPERICTMLDVYYHTTAFSKVFTENKENINRYFEEQIHAMEEAPNQILLEYHLILPGKVSFSNAEWNHSDTLIWKINAIRLYASEGYKLMAESRKTNIWAFIITFLAGLGLLIFCVRQKK